VLLKLLRLSGAAGFSFGEFKKFKNIIAGCRNKRSFPASMSQVTINGKGR
jgi:hypothetical protein